MLTPSGMCCSCGLAASGRLRPDDCIGQRSVHNQRSGVIVIATVGLVAASCHMTLCLLKVVKSEKQTCGRNM